MAYRRITIVNLDSVAVEISSGDIERLPFRVDALVSLDDGHLAARSSVARAIRSRAKSNAVDVEIASLTGFPNSTRILSLGDIRTTGAGDANATFIFHVVVFDAHGRVNENILSATIDQALQMADAEELRSIAVPILDGMALASCHGIRQFAQRRPRNLQAVMLIARSEDEANRAANFKSFSLVPSAKTPTTRPPPATNWSPSASARIVPPLLAYTKQTSKHVVPMTRQQNSTTSPLPSIPEPLKRAYQNRRLVLFVGSGLSQSTGVKGNFPAWKDLPTRLLGACAEYDAIPNETVANKRELFKQRMSLEQMLHELGTLRAVLSRDYQNALNDIFRPDDAAPGVVHDALLQLNARSILTTNYDELIEIAAARNQTRLSTYTWEGASRALNDLQGGRPVLLKVHGTANDFNSVVMTAQEYERAHSNEPYRAVLQYLLQDNTFLFLGYGVNDPYDLDLALRHNAAAFGTSARKHYALLPNPAETDIDRMARDYNVRAISYSDHGIIESFLRTLMA